MKILKPSCLSVLHRTVASAGGARVVVTAMACVDLGTGTALLEAELWEAAESALGLDGVLDDGFAKPCGEVLVTGSAHAAAGASNTDVTVAVAVGDVRLEAVVPPGPLRGDVFGPRPFAHPARQSTFLVGVEALRAPAYFAGDERWSLAGVHPVEAVLEGVLPGLAARVFVAHGDDVEGVPVVLDTLHFFPAVKRVVLLFRGSVAVREAFAPSALLAALERLDAPRSDAHYRAVIAGGAVTGDVTAREAALAPDGAEGLDALAARAPSPRREGVREARARARANAEREVLRQRLVRLGVEADAYLDAPSGDAVADAPSAGEALDVQLAAQAARESAHEEAAVALKLRVEARARELAERFGADVPAPTPAGPPGVAKDGPSTRALAAYRRNAHLRPALMTDATAGAELRARVTALRSEGASLAGADLTGASLSGMALAGVDLREALLEGADLTGADLTAADLTGAVLVRARLSGANLTRTRLRGANLGGATLDGARSDGGLDLVDATLQRTVLAAATLDGANLDGATLDDVDLAGASLAGLQARGTSFHGVLLTHAKLPGATLDGAVFVGCDLSRADLSGATLKGATFASCRAPGARFVRADAEGLRVVDDVDMAAADLTGAKLRHATMRGVHGAAMRLAGCAADRSDWSGADLQGADLAKGSFVDALLCGADLRGATAEGAVFLGAVLQRARIDDADLSDAVLFGADLAGWTGVARSTRGLVLDRVRIAGGAA